MIQPRLFVVVGLSLSFVVPAMTCAQSTVGETPESWAVKRQQMVWDRERKQEERRRHDVTPDTLKTYIYSLRAARLFDAEGHDLLAAKLYERAVDTHPLHALLFMQLRDRVEHFTLGAYPKSFAGILNEIAWTHATSPCPEARDGQKAVFRAQYALQLHPEGKAFYQDTMAAGYAEMGDFANAVETQKRAISSLAEGSGQKAEFDLRLDLYQRKLPYRQKRKLPLWITIKDKSGRFEVAGRFTTFDGMKVKLLKESGGEIFVPIHRLPQTHYDALRRALDDHYVIYEAEKWDLFDEGLPFKELIAAAEAATRQITK